MAGEAARLLHYCSTTSPPLPPRVTKAGRLLTRKLWGAANSGPFMHHGKFTIESDFSRYIIDSKSPVGLDLLIVDDKHLGIAFSRLSRPREQTKELAIRFWDQPEVVRLFGDWFDKLTKSGIAIPYAEAERQYREAQIAKFPAA